MSDTLVDTSISRKAKDVTAGFVGGAVQVLIGQPFDLIKVRLQTGQFRSPIEAFQSTLKNEGARAFYKGTLAPLFGVGACVSVQFYGFHEAKRQLLKYSNSQTLTMGQVYLAGAFSGFVNTPITSPVEQLRIISQTQKTTPVLGPKQLLRNIYTEHGLVRGVFRGFNITLVRECQAYGTWFLTYEYLMQNAIKSRNITRDQISTPELMAYGALAGEMLWLSSYPLDVIKSRIQSDGFGAAKSKYNGKWNLVIKDIMRVDGIRGFWRGIGPALVRAIPCSAGTFATVELTLRLLG
ncbi:hypothetical protein BABINDRAFT_159674 [Babjeviella inositovora NRRL Y-12698]|uniref:Mitochondrial carrier protein n=1 Tax=Babjeviella inositovora NRRL Y-12698 TaxID=984486 RepID=A0A1E3R1G2_9ASCO|nr:uncharacterized protein BABINDRAFT_159674 [Babjeviella inositovora NRRL Y-12698]ODQ83237.1 hypothetical protein BABINDRAFT_159674 [Babjeviella inositovora NRRL Y-12698]